VIVRISDDLKSSEGAYSSLVVALRRVHCWHNQQRSRHYLLSEQLWPRSQAHSYFSGCWSGQGMFLGCFRLNLSQNSQ
jgi:hypothetical protein